MVAKNTVIMVRVIITASHRTTVAMHGEQVNVVVIYVHALQELQNRPSPITMHGMEAKITGEFMDAKVMWILEGKESSASACNRTVPTHRQLMGVVDLNHGAMLIVRNLEEIHIVIQILVLLT